MNSVDKISSIRGQTFELIHSKILSFVHVNYQAASIVPHFVSRTMTADSADTLLVLKLYISNGGNGGAGVGSCPPLP